jgi:hypothetical protein
VDLSLELLLLDSASIAGMTARIDAQGAAVASSDGA